MMRLYHGTTSDFGEIDLTKSKPSKDFGRGFYLSAEVEQAKGLCPNTCAVVRRFTSNSEL